jgi:CBS domain-containing protein
MDVGELCMRTVVIARPDEPIVKAAQRMREMHVGSLVVVDETGEVRRPIGMVTDRDLLFAFAGADPREVAQLRLERVMSPELVTAHEGEHVHQALDRMREHGVRRLPVVDDNGILVGILAHDDLVEWVGEQLDELARVVSTEQKRERRRR